MGACYAIVRNERFNELFSLEEAAVWIRIHESMNIRIFIATCTACIACMLPSHADDTALAKQMEILNDAYKSMRKEENPAKGAALARESQDAMIKAIVEVPELVKAMADGPEKIKASAEYRMMMANLIASLAEMELAFLNNDMAKVKTIVEKMRESKKQGHDKFMEEE